MTQGMFERFVRTIPVERTHIATFTVPIPAARYMYPRLMWTVLIVSRLVSTIRAMRIIWGNTKSMGFRGQ